MSRPLLRWTAALGIVLALSACTNPYDPGQRAAGGALIGAGSGAAIGGAIGGWQGAGIGALVGGAAGAVTGVATTPQPPPQDLHRRRRSGTTRRHCRTRSVVDYPAIQGSAKTCRRRRELARTSTRNGHVGTGAKRAPIVSRRLMLIADRPSPRAPGRKRRLSDHILIAFHSACDQGDLEAADRLLAILECVLRRLPPAGHPERRTDARPLVAAHERLWTLRHPEAGDG